MKSKKLLSFILVAAMTISLLPTFTLTASAAITTEKNITLGATALKGGQASNVYFGNYQQLSLGNTEPTEGTKGIDWINSTTATKNSQGPYYSKDPIKWRVLSNADGKALLLSDKNLDVVRYHKDYEEVTWATSTIRSWLNGYGASLNTGGESGKDYTSDNFIDSAFSDSEQQAIADTNVVNNDNPIYNTEDGNDTTDKVFLLSIEEAQNTSYFANNDSRKAINTAYVCGGGKNGTSMYGIGVADYWWLRSPGDISRTAADVNIDGGVGSNGNDVSNSYTAVRPAFNLNLSSVLFTSAAFGGKSGNVGTLSANAENAGGAYKLTMLDESRKDFSASLKSLSGNTAKVSYSGAKTETTETKEYISVIIKNENDVKYYGIACKVSDSSGEVTFTLPRGFDEENGDLLCVFNEQINGDYKTDYASNFVTVVTTETGLKNAVKSNGTVVLGKDITISETLEIGKNVILDLAGFTITKTGNKTNYGVIKVNENTNFTLKDSSTAQTGEITGGNANKGGGVYVDSDSTFVMEGGTISGCEASYGGGVYVDSDSTFVMEGGTITDCTASSYLKAVVNVNGGATFNMKGGIIYCSNENDAVFVNDDATVKNDSQTSATFCYGGLINIFGDRSGYFIRFNDKNLYAGELIPNTGRVVMPEEPEKAGYTFDGWYTEDGTNNGDWGDKCTRETTVTKNTNLFARWTPIPAAAPTVTSSQNVNVIYGSYTNETISVTVTDKDEDTYSYSYQWYDSSKNEISGATENTYTIPDDLAVGSYDYYCAVTAKRKDNGETETANKTIKVKVDKADSETTVTPSTTVVTYGETLTLTATVGKPKAKAVGSDEVEFYLVEDESETLLGTANVVYEDENKKDAGTATLTIDTKNKQLKIDDNTITAQYGGSVNLNGGERDTITVTLEKKPVGLTWENWDNLVYDGNPKNVSATTTNFIPGDDVSLNITDGDKTNAGTYTATASLSGEYAKYYTLLTNDTTQKYTINPKTVTATIGTIPDQTYTGSEIKPPITAYDSTTVIPTSEYTVAYSKNENAGTTTVTLTDNTRGNYTVSGSTKFEILRKSIDGATVGTFAEMKYSGDEQTPSATVTIDGLTATGEWSKVKNVSDKTTFTADGNFEGTISDITPNMEKKSIENATVALDGELTYNGQPQTQNITLTLDGFTNVTFDVSDNEQTNVKPDGDYTLTVTGTGNFTGTKTLDWNIKPYTPTENPNNKTTARVRRGRTLAEATVTEGEMLGLNDTVLEGTFAWVDGTTETINADCTKQMTFTPTDTNYAPITIDVAVSTYSSSGGGSSVTRYTVKFNTNGGNSITSQTVKKNGTATEPTKPTKEGYIFDGWYTDSKFTTEYDFDTKVAKNITLYAKWVEDEVQEPSDDKKDDEQKPTTDEWKNPFADVTKSDWFFDNVRYANENGLMSGVTNTEFAPNLTLTRGMLVTILYRLAGEPAVNKSIPFGDVTSNSYYRDAVIWAQQNGIVSGISKTEFTPDENITREQIATIIYRYAKYKGYDVSVGEDTNILSYTDFNEISEYAIEAMQYAVGSGLIKGKTENTLNPKDNATRAEIAAILNRFIEGNK